MPALTLTSAERRAHRAAAHHLDPVVMIGGEGLTPGVQKEVAAALDAHGLIKLRVMADDRSLRETVFAELCDRLDAAPIQHIGKLLVLWRAPVEKAKAVDQDRKAGPKVVKVLKFSKSGNHRAQVKKLTVLGNQRLTAGGIVKRAKKRVTSAKKKPA
ncbi:MAG TPA: YhbY family RNA-binding protein [Methylibium sp.]|uniref:YhbY family RNA-binding protein n=1 Tax=Methylibium sp. TaxID=2067992 RepID=UPI002DBACAB9|nr:YhbY family RNA-binding protein [Methylibium sp.]HEU4459054.1 YhbY family RNA-binding protein [Methylibium sp.]